MWRGPLLPICLALLALGCATTAPPTTARVGDRGARGHRHVHLPGEARGVRLYPVFARAMSATVYADRRWLIPPAAIDSFAAHLAALRPTLVSGLFLLGADELPTVEHRRAFDRIRDRVRAVVPDARFDVVLDAIDYSQGVDVVQHMRALDDAFLPDLWMFEHWDVADDERYAVVVSAIGQAHANGQAIGGVTRSTEIPEDSDYGVVEERGARPLEQRLTRLSLYHAIPYLVRRTDTAAVLPSGGRTRAYPLWMLSTSATGGGMIPIWLNNARPPSGGRDVIPSRRDTLQTHREPPLALTHPRGQYQVIGDHSQRLGVSPRIEQRREIAVLGPTFGFLM